MPRYPFVPTPAQTSTSSTTSTSASAEHSPPPHLPPPPPPPSTTTTSSSSPLQQRRRPQPSLQRPAAAATATTTTNPSDNNNNNNNILLLNHRRSTSSSLHRRRSTSSSTSSSSSPSRSHRHAPPSPPRHADAESQFLTAAPYSILAHAQQPQQQSSPPRRRPGDPTGIPHFSRPRGGGDLVHRDQILHDDDDEAFRYASTNPVVVQPPPPIPPPHRESVRSVTRPWSNQPVYTTAAHGLSGVAMSVADANPRESGIEAMHHTPAHDPRDLYPYEDVYARPPMMRGEMSNGSMTPLGGHNAGMSPGMQTPTTRSTTSVQRSVNSDNPYSDTAYPYSSRRQSRNLEELDPSIGFDPDSIADDGDDGLHYGQPAKRGSVLSLGHTSDHNRHMSTGAARGGVLSSLGAMVGRPGSGDYAAANAVPPGQAPAYNLSGEKGGSLAREATKKRRKMIILIVGAIVLIGAIVGGIAGGVLSSNGGSSKSQHSGPSAASDTAQNGDLGKDSTEIKALMNNKDLHKVFPGIDYTPMNTQYPDCLTAPPSQNNFTRDLAILSQLTNNIRLYGTDCVQTQMLLHSIDRLGMNDTVKVWLGVWQDKNATTNERQLNQLYQILDDYDEKHFLGVIVGNEVLFRKDKTIAEMVEIIGWVRSNLTSRGLSLPVASSDLGDNWTADFAGEVDYVMSNIHPFFAGTPAAQGAQWTMDFWTSHDVPLTSDQSKQIIAETGWPTQGGTDCGGATTCTEGAVAGIDELNTFMQDWVCPALDNGTHYFWFEAFDEPWKIRYKEAGKEWEDHWGLLTADRVLKDGVRIPDCGGKTVS